MGDYDQFAVDGTSAFDAAWADNWSSSGFHANSGTGANDCNNLNAGGSTHFLNSATVPVAAGVAPFGGSFLPEQPLQALVGVPSDGVWTLRIADTVSGDTGTIGCFSLRIARVP